MLKKVIKKLRDIMIKAKDKIIEFVLSRYGDTRRAIYFFTIFLISLLVGVTYMECGLPKLLAFILFFCLTFIAGGIALYVVGFLVEKIAKLGVKLLICLFLLITFVAEISIKSTKGILEYSYGVLMAVIMIVTILYFICGIYAIVINKKRNKFLYLSTSLACIASMVIVVVLYSEGFEDDYINHYVKLNQVASDNVKYEKRQDNKALIGQELKTGDYTVEVLDYGTKRKKHLIDFAFGENKKIESLEGGTANISRFVTGYEGFQEFYRNWYFGFDIKNVPMSGRIWYPKEKDNCPIVFIVHGNHNFTTDSYLGYEYLAKYLASHGYVVASVDENILNGSSFGSLSGENDGRAILLLENVKQVLKYSLDQKCILFNKIDANNIALAGHSRGGEAVATATYFNTLSNYPEDGNLSFDYGFSIKSVIAIAPTVDQYKPADHSVELNDINYFLIQGANDQDISVFMGAKQYNNITYSKESSEFKSYLYIAGANHGQFNTLWGRYDLTGPVSEFMNVQNLLTKKQQQKILKVSTKLFLDVTLMSEYEKKDFFYGIQEYEDGLPDTVYIQDYKDGSYDFICTFEEDLDLTTATMENVTVDAKGFDQWTEKLSRYSNSNISGNKDDYAVSLQYNDSLHSSFHIHMDKQNPYDATNKKLSFDVIDMDNADVKQEDYKKLDCSIILTDKNGQRMKAVLSDFYTVYPPLPVRLSKLQYIFSKNEYKHQFQTVQIPVNKFMPYIVKEDFDSSQIVEIEFLFDIQEDGNIRLDDIGFCY